MASPVTKSVLEDHDANPVAIAKALDLDYGDSWLEWVPEMVRDELKITADYDLDRVMACQVAKTNPDAFSSWQVFHAVGEAFNHRLAHFQWLTPLTFLEAAWTCEALRQLEPQYSFDGSAQRYLGTVCLNDGLVYFPWTGGQGLVVPGLDWANGLMAAGARDTAEKLQALWQAGELPAVRLADEKLPEDEVLYAQIDSLLRGQEYIRAQHSSDPMSYRK